MLQGTMIKKSKSVSETNRLLVTEDLGLQECIKEYEQGYKKLSSILMLF